MRAPSLTSSLTIVAVSLFAASAAAAEPANVTLELPGATLKGDGATWGGWIADVEKPRSGAAMAGRGVDIARVDGVPVNSSATTTVRTPHKDKIDLIGFGYEVKSPRDSASGQASGKRGEEPAMADNGSVLIHLAEPWGGCAVGQRFDGVTLTVGGTRHYRLDGLQVARCSAQEAAFVYARVQPQ